MPGVPFLQSVSSSNFFPAPLERRARCLWKCVLSLARHTCVSGRHNPATDSTPQPRRHVGGMIYDLVSPMEWECRSCVTSRPRVLRSWWWPLAFPHSVLGCRGLWCPGRWSGHSTQGALVPKWLQDESLPLTNNTHTQLHVCKEKTTGCLAYLGFHYSTQNYPHLMPNTPGREGKEFCGDLELTRPFLPLQMSCRAG